jgi:quercetin dioxygenase-like cupin family protein
MRLDMIDIQQYIESGILEEYCSGCLPEDEQQQVITYCNLYPQIKAELNAIEAALEHYASMLAVEPGDHVKENFLKFVDEEEQALNAVINTLPLIDQHTDHQLWLQTLKPIIPANVGNERFVHVLKGQEGLMQALVVSKTGVEMETHDDIKESFLILEGKCKCTIGNDVFYYRTGDYFAIPLYTPHNIEVLTPTITVILQQIAA